MELFKKRDDDLVRLATFTTPMEAHLLKTLLESNGIAASVAGEESNATFSHMGLGDSGLVGVQVLVKRINLKDAKLVMNEVPAASNELFPDWVCGCGETVDEGFSVCWSCGKPHQDIE